MLKKLFLPLFCIFSLTTTAQKTENTGWLALSNSTKLSDRFSTFLDIQFRGADKLEYVNNFIFRPGLTYNFNKSVSATLGYMYAPVYSKISGDIERFDENRIWQQLQIAQKAGSVLLTHRFRYEQRFIEQVNSDFFSQRGRYFIKAVLPLKKDSTFNKGTFLSLADEVFVNLSNKEKLGQHFFDQNRAYVGVGYRFSPKVDVEVNYLWRLIQGPTQTRQANVALLSLSTRF